MTTHCRMTRVKQLMVIALTVVICVLSGPSLRAQQPERLQNHSSLQDEPMNPVSFGLLDLTDAKQRYEILSLFHEEAFNQHRPVSYKGIDTLYLEVPDDARPLPLTYNTDFAGVVIFIRNDSEKDITLFTLDGDKPLKEIAVDKQMLKNGDFRSHPELQVGDYLLVVNDRNPWTERTGYGYKVYRSDLVYVSNGIGRNQTVTGYDNAAADPKYSYVPVNDLPKDIQNITIHRGRNEKHKTYCFRISNQNNVTLRNVHITTPKTKFNADGAITLSNCANCTVQDVTVDSTYSYPGGYGYAISMNNTLNTTFVRFKADAAWGVFGTNNVNNVTLRECDVNRFDIHCYGRDAHLINCTLRNKQTQFSSMYGEVTFDSCYFKDCIPVRIRSSYNAYTPFDIKIRHCTFDVTLRHHALVNVMLLSTEANKRQELAPRCWPNVYIEDLTVNMPFLTRKLQVVDPTGTVSECKKAVDYMQRIEINGLRTLRNGRREYCDLYLSKRRFKTKEPFRFNYKNVDLGGGKIINLINE